MKTILGLLMSMLCLTGCMVEGTYGPPPDTATNSGVVEFCNDEGCRYVDAPYYYVGSDVVYWDFEFGMWIGPHSYWDHGWHQGCPPGYHHRYEYHSRYHHEEREHHHHGHHRGR